VFLPPSITSSLQATVWLTQHSFPHSFIPFPPRPLPPSLNISLGHRVAHAALTTKPGHFCDLWSRGRAGALAVVRREGGRAGGRAALFILPAASFPYLSTFHTAPSLPPSLSPSLPPSSHYPSKRSSSPLSSSSSSSSSTPSSPGTLSLLNSRVLSSQPLVALDWHRDKAGLCAIASLGTPSLPPFLPPPFSWLP